MRAHVIVSICALKNPSAVPDRKFIAAAANLIVTRASPLRNFTRGELEFRRRVPECRIGFCVAPATLLSARARRLIVDYAIHTDTRVGTYIRTVAFFAANMFERRREVRAWCLLQNPENDVTVN